MATLAARCEDHWLVNGQKVWTTMAHRADFGLLLARTDRSVPKHAGLSYFVVDMHAPAIDVRPLRQIAGGTTNINKNVVAERILGLPSDRHD